MIEAKIILHRDDVGEIVVDTQNALEFLIEREYRRDIETGREDKNASLFDWLDENALV